MRMSVRTDALQVIIINITINITIIIIILLLPSCWSTSDLINDLDSVGTPVDLIDNPSLLSGSLTLTTRLFT